MVLFNKTLLSLMHHSIKYIYEITMKHIFLSSIEYLCSYHVHQQNFGYINFNELRLDLMYKSTWGLNQAILVIRATPKY
jgi:hypothetical protein